MRLPDELRKLATELRRRVGQEKQAKLEKCALAAQATTGIGTLLRKLSR